MLSVIYTNEFIDAFNPVRVNVACYIQEKCKAVKIDCPTPRNPYCPSFNNLGELWDLVATAYMERRSNAVNQYRKG